MQIDVVIEAPEWEAVDLAGIADRAVRATLRHLSLERDGVGVSLLGCDDARIAALNADFRGKPQPTNVLSWPAEDLAPGMPGGDPAPPGLEEIGDIAIAYETCAREAVAQGKPLDAHVTHLLVHATLHLLGYDHMTDPDADKMEALEVEILATLGVPDPY